MPANISTRKRVEIVRRGYELEALGMFSVSRLASDLHISRKTALRWWGED